MSSIGARRFLVTGGTGLVGTNLTAAMRARGDDVVSVGSAQADLADLGEARRLMSDVKPSSVIHLAALVGGIHANSTRKADFYEQNTLINTHVVIAAREAGVEEFHAMGTGCAYPKRLESQDLHESQFLEGRPEPTNDAYAYAKRNLLVHLSASQEQHGMRYTYMIPANLFGPHDNFHPTHSHVVPGLLVRFLRAADEGAASVAVWGTGKAERDFLYVADCVEAILTLVQDRGASGTFNVATGHRHSIAELADIIRDACGFEGRLAYDRSYPDGQSTRIMNTERMRQLGWSARTPLRAGIEKTVEWCREHRDLWAAQSPA